MIVLQLGIGTKPVSHLKKENRVQSECGTADGPGGERLTDRAANHLVGALPVSVSLSLYPPPVYVFVIVLLFFRGHLSGGLRTRGPAGLVIGNSRGGSHPLYVFLSLFMGLTLLSISGVQ